MEKSASIYVAGHRGLVGSAILRKLTTDGYDNIITRSHAELDLLDPAAVARFFADTRPEYVFLAAARVGGIWANNAYPADFLHQNLVIQNNVLFQAHRHRVERLVFLGSSCIYPKYCPQPMKEEHLLTGPLEPTNEPYAVAKIAGIEMCWAFNRQFDARFIPVMPTNLYGPNDNFDLSTSHVLPALIRKHHLAKLAAEGQWDDIAKDEDRFGSIPDDILAGLIAVSNHHGKPVPDHFSARISTASGLGGRSAGVNLWGTGAPKREFLHADDLAAACIFLIDLPWDRINSQPIYASQILGEFSAENAEGKQNRKPDTQYREPNRLLFNIGTGKDANIRELARLVASVVGFEGETYWDTSKPDGTPQKLLDVTRMKHIGWQARIDLKNGIEQTYKWYKRQVGLKEI